MAEVGLVAEPAVYLDEMIDNVREQLLRVDGVLVWVDPIAEGGDRSKLDPLLREVSSHGIWVSAHPDVILKMATKRVLVDTRELTWGSDAHLYRRAAELRDRLPARLAGGAARVLKRERGMGGQGVWKVELGEPGQDPVLCVEHAVRDASPEHIPLSEFIVRCEPYFADGGLMVDQPFQERIGEGMIRVYLTHDAVVGFAHQFPTGLRPASAGEPPSGKVFELSTAPGYSGLRELMESKWVPELQQILGFETHSLPVIWDADFLYGPKTVSGDDTFVLCEINASSTFAFPEHAMSTVARAAIDRIRER
jgi:hypothetical protein